MTTRSPSVVHELLLAECLLGAVQTRDRMADAVGLSVAVPVAVCPSTRARGALSLAERRERGVASQPESFAEVQVTTRLRASQLTAA